MVLTKKNSFSPKCTFWVKCFPICIYNAWHCSRLSMFLSQEMSNLNLDRSDVINIFVWGWGEGEASGGKTDVFSSRGLGYFGSLILEWSFIHFGVCSFILEWKHKIIQFGQEGQGLGGWGSKPPPPPWVMTLIIAVEVLINSSSVKIFSFKRN